MYRINDLIKMDRKLFHSQDLAILWGISNKNTLYTAVKRYRQQGVLVPVYKGLYATLPLAQLNPLELGLAVVHQYAYLSTESVLAQKGLINQTPTGNTFISGISKKISIGTEIFIYRKLKAEYLNNRAGLIDQNGIPTASVERAVADLLYFNPKYHFDLKIAINWDQVKLIQQTVGYI